MKIKNNTVKRDLMEGGREYAFIDVLECTMGDALGCLDCYTHGNNDGAIMKPQVDYEMILRPKRKRSAYKKATQKQLNHAIEWEQDQVVLQLLLELKERRKHD